MQALEKLSRPLKWHGGKARLASKIVGMMPSHLHYVEPFAGGLSVLLEKNPEGVSEVVNDANRALTNFWRVLRCEVLFPDFVRQVECVPFSEAEFRDCRRAGQFDRGSDPVSWAVDFFILCRQSIAGRMAAGGFAPLSRTRTRGGQNEQAYSWERAVQGLSEVHRRLRRVAILSRPALDVIRGQDGPDTLFYLDPPYLMETRTSPKVYAHEMTDADHAALLDALAGIRGRFLLSGYPSALYDAAAERRGWHRTDFDLANHAAGGESKRRMTECVWTNFKPNGDQ